jgi:TRAP-type uncharacterized transport system substrate-binding protein
MSNDTKYRITSTSKELDRLEQFYATAADALEMAEEYADDYQVPVDVHEWAYGYWHELDTVLPKKK